MIKITIVSVIKRQPAWVETAVKEYRKRLSSDTSLNIINVTPTNRSKNAAIDKVLLNEAEGILKVVPKDNLTIVLDEKGNGRSTQNIAGKMEEWANMNQSICFIIGGPDGLDPTIKSMANETWSLSDLTLPHALVRVILVEQLYRAFCILKNHPYHRE